MKTFKHIRIPETWEHYWTKYPEGYTILESLIDWVSQANIVTDNVNEWNNYLDDFVNNFDNNLHETALLLLEEWKKDGTLNAIIGDELFTINKELSDKIQEVSDRVNDIITNPAEGVSAEEIQDAREGKESLGDNIRDIRKDLKTFDNLIFNGDFPLTYGWRSLSGSTITADNNNLIITGDGTSNMLRATQNDNADGVNLPIYVAGDKYYMSAYFKVPDNNANDVRLSLYGVGLPEQRIIVSEPPPNKLVRVSGVVSLPEGAPTDTKLLLQLRATYPTSASTDGLSVEVSKVVLLNLSALFGQGKEPTAEEIELVTDRFTMGYFNKEADVGKVALGALDHSIENRRRIDKLPTKKSFLYGEYTNYYRSPAITSKDDTTDEPLNSSLISHVYGEYDKLVSDYPDIVSRTLVGYGGGVDGLEDNTLPIYEYTVTPPKTLGYVELPTPPKILIQTGLHGFEKAAVWSTLEFFKQLLGSWMDNTGLASIRANIQFKIIPIANPYGYNELQRENARGVDLNRNFEYRWGNLSEDDKGSYPYSEVESRVLREWYLSNRDAALFIDYHNTWEYLQPCYFVSYDRHLLTIFGSILRRFTYEWEARFGTESNNIALGWTQTGGAGHAYADAMYLAGIKHSCLIESARDFDGELNNSVVLERGVDVISNTILAYLNQYNTGIEEG